MNIRHPRHLPVLLLLLCATTTLFAQSPAVPPSPNTGPIFVFKTNEFWLNLHSFLYVLGRDRSGAADRTRAAVAGAPSDEARGLATLSDADARIWRETVTAYANGLSKLDAIFDDAMIDVTGALARLDDPAAPLTSLPAERRPILERAAPIYRKPWWPAHEKANVARVNSLRPLIDRHGAAMLAFIVKVYAARWPSSGYPINVCAYSNWAGAYSTRGNLLVMSSLDSATSGTSGLEIAFHESMHQWDDDVERDLAAAARALGKPLPADLSHAMIFYTAGEAARRVIPGHVPYAEANGIWNRRLGVFRNALEMAWRPWLDGKTSREAALADLVRIAAGLTRPTRRAE